MQTSASRTVWEEDSNYSLIEGIFEAADRLASQHPSSGAKDQERLTKYCRDLGLWSDREKRPLHHLEIQRRPLEALNELPSKLPHAGKYTSAGGEHLGMPRWLWDSKMSKTVTADQTTLEDGYVAVSYTWGRWRSGKVTQPGTRWQVPITAGCDFNISTLKSLLQESEISRYFWIDVLCIDQDNPAEVREEVAKQGAIFGSAKGVITYLWTLETAESLSHALADLGDILLWWLRIARPGARERAKITDEERNLYGDHYGQSLRSDYWFSSLWTLQEMILAPASQWIYRDGSYCMLNDKPVTTHLIASACELLTKLTAMQDRLIENIVRRYHEPDHIKWIKAVQKENRSKLEGVSAWGKWGVRHASLSSCLSASRAGILLAGASRQATKRRGLAVLAALKVGYDPAYEDDVGLEPGKLPIALIQTLLNIEGRMVLSCMHGREPLSGILPTTADACHHIDRDDFESLPSQSSTILWKLIPGGSLVIPKGSLAQKFKSGRSVLWPNGASRIDVPMKYAKKAIKQYLGDHQIHVKFLPVALRKNMSEALAFEHMVFENAQGVILVTTKSKPPKGQDIIWQKFGMYNADSFQENILKIQLVVRTN